MKKFLKQPKMKKALKIKKKGFRLTDTDFGNLHQTKKSEVLFFIEALSLIDSMKNSNFFYEFCYSATNAQDENHIFADMPDFFAPGSKSQGYTAALYRIFELIEEICGLYWIVPNRIRALARLAHGTHGDKVREDRGNKKQLTAKAWKELSVKFNQLADDLEGRGNSNSEECNRAPGPFSWKARAVYVVTVCALYLASLYYFYFWRA